jgi:U3 small nucleolar RNA-associated protein 22
MALNLKRKRVNRNDGALESKVLSVYPNFLLEKSFLLQKRLIDEEHEDSEDDDMPSDNDDEMGQDWQGIAQPSPPIQPQSSSKPFKPPTGEELRTIKDASSLFRSNSFKLQVCSIYDSPLHPNVCLDRRPSSQCSP